MSVQRMLSSRAASVAAARHAMNQLGVSWGQVRTWALGEGWMPADVPQRTINPRAVEAYKAAVGEAWFSPLSVSNPAAPGVDL